MSNETPSQPSTFESAGRIVQFWPVIGIPAGVGLFVVLFLQGQALREQNALLEQDVAALHGQVVEFRETLTHRTKGGDKGAKAASNPLADAAAKARASAAKGGAGKAPARNATGSGRTVRKAGDEATARASGERRPAGAKGAAGGGAGAGKGSKARKGDAPAPEPTVTQ